MTFVRHRIVKRLQHLGRWYSIGKVNRSFFVYDSGAAVGPYSTAEQAEDWIRAKNSPRRSYFPGPNPSRKLVTPAIAGPSEEGERVVFHRLQRNHVNT